MLIKCMVVFNLRIFFSFLQGKLTFIRELISHLPTKTEDEIRQHENWFHEYLNLNDVKKEAIQRWKEKKEVGCDRHLFF